MYEPLWGKKREIFQRSITSEIITIPTYVILSMRSKKHRLKMESVKSRALCSKART